MSSEALPTNVSPIRPGGTERADVVIVGARVAGAATAMLLARHGLKVIAVDRTSYGSDTLSTHALMRGAVQSLERWGLLDEVKAAGTPPIEFANIRYGDDELTVEVAGKGRGPLYAPRRTVIDPIIVDAARESGADVRFGVRFEELIANRHGRVRGITTSAEDGTRSRIRADLVIGADGLRSSVARAVESPITLEGRGRSSIIMRHFRDVDLAADRYHWLWGDQVGGGIVPSNDGVMAVFTGMPPERFATEARADVEGTFARVLHELDPARAEAVLSATPAGPIRSFPGVTGRFRKAFGPGWALVGDAGYFKDPYAAHGMTDAFRDVQLLTDAILVDDLAGYEATRNRASMPVFELLEQITSYDWDMATLKERHIQLSYAMRDELTVTAAA
jgi:2-polyprenyl-6-methoxyphenol hydroxylase-like FAD-dependent oxidoreductase